MNLSREAPSPANSRPPRLAAAASARQLPRLLPLVVLICFVLAGGCSRQDGAKDGAGARQSEALFRVGSIVVYQADLDHALTEKRVNPKDEAARRRILDELAARAQSAQAALDARLLEDPEVRSQWARTLASRLKEMTLAPRLKELNAPIPTARLQELYKAGEARFHSNEKRQVAVLWLNPNGNPERTRTYQEKLEGARDWLQKSPELKDHPDQGFSVLSVDHSEHAPSRFKGGVVGWLEREGGPDAWTKAVAEIAFGLHEPGEVSSVVSRAEGIFVVRYMAQKPAITRPFETVSAELERNEQQQRRAAAEAKYEADIKAKHPVEWLRR